MLFASSILFLISAIGCSVVNSLDWLIIFRLLGGVGVGVASIVVPLYISEIAPADRRGRLVTCYQLAITVGILLAYVTNSLLLSYSEKPLGTTFSGLAYLVYVKEVWRGMFSIGAFAGAAFSGRFILCAGKFRYGLERGVRGKS